MKLNSIQTERTLSQFEAQVLPDDHPALRQLSGIFGDHTFFLDGAGLNVLEPGEMAETGAQTGEIVTLASWSDETLTSSDRTSRNQLASLSRLSGRID